MPPPGGSVPLPGRCWPILTQQPRVPWASVALIQLPWFTLIVIEETSRTVMTFTVRQYVSAAWIITLLTSFNVVFNLLVGAPCNYLSDKVWTRWGRRRPFLVVANLIACGFLLFIPLIRDLWPLVVAMFFYEMLRDIGTQTEPLEKEVVPPPQRGRGQAITSLVKGGAALFFSAVLLVQFGNRQNWAVYLISATMMIFWMSLGNLEPLLFTEQFGYSKATLGWIKSVAHISSLVVILPLSGWIADKFDRVGLFQVCAVATVMHHIAFYVYARHFAPGGIPTEGVLVGFWVLKNAVMTVGVIAAVALQFDYIETSRMGTLSAGIGITRTIFDLLTRNIIGIWISFYSAHFVAGGANDYLSGYLYLILASLAGAGAALWIARLIRSGRLVPHGRIEQEQRLAQGSARGG